MFITLTAFKICVPTPTPATAVAPNRPTISVSTRPTSDSSPKVMIAGHASDQTMRIRSKRVAVGDTLASVIGVEALVLMGLREVKLIRHGCQLGCFHAA